MWQHAEKDKLGRHWQIFSNEVDKMQMKRFQWVTFTSAAVTRQIVTVETLEYSGKFSLSWCNRRVLLLHNVTISSLKKGTPKTSVLPVNCRMRSSISFLVTSSPLVFLRHWRSIYFSFGCWQLRVKVYKLAAINSSHFASNWQNYFEHLKDASG